MIDDAKVILAPTRINAFKKNKGVSPTSVPVEDVEAWLDEHPEKRLENNGNRPAIKGESKNNKLPAFMLRPSSKVLAESEEVIKKRRAKAKKEYRQALAGLDKAANIRKCSKCGELKPLDDEHFYRTASKSLSGHCKECAKKYARAYRDKKRANK